MATSRKRAREAEGDGVSDVLAANREEQKRLLLEPPPKRFKDLWEAADECRPPRLLLMNDVPEELLDKVCDYLDWKALAMMRFTCKRFFGIVECWVKVKRLKVPVLSLSLYPRDVRETYWDQIPRTLYLITGVGQRTPPAVHRLPLWRAPLCINQGGIRDVRMDYKDASNSHLIEYMYLEYSNTTHGVTLHADGSSIGFSRGSLFARDPILQADRKIYRHTKKGHAFSKSSLIVATNDLQGYIVSRKDIHPTIRLLLGLAALSTAPVVEHTTSVPVHVLRGPALPGAPVPGVF